MHYEGLNLLNEKLGTHVHCGIKPKEEKIKSIERT